MTPVEFGTRVAVTRYAVRVAAKSEAWGTTAPKVLFAHVGVLRTDRGRYPLLSPKQLGLAVPDNAGGAWPNENDAWPGLGITTDVCPTPVLLKRGLKDQWGGLPDDYDPEQDYRPPLELEPLPDNGRCFVRVRRIPWEARGIVIGRVFKQEGERHPPQSLGMDDYQDGYLSQHRRVPLYEVATEIELDESGVSRRAVILTCWRDDLSPA